MRSSQSDRGTTLVEAVLALVLLSVACGGAFRTARSITAAADRVSRLASSDRSLVRANTLLRESVSRVRYPPRTAGLGVEKRTAGLRLPYLDGDALRHLDISFRDRQLVVYDGLAVERVRGFASASFDFLYNGESSNAAAPVPVVVVRLATTGGARVPIFANVGSWPFLPARSGDSGGR